MRKGISKAERRKALAIAAEHARVSEFWDRMDKYDQIPSFLGAGAFNVVYAVTADLVMRVEQEPSNASSWQLYELAQKFPSSELPVVYELGTLGTGHRYAIVERMGVCLADTPEYLERGYDKWEMVAELAEPLVAYVERVTGPCEVHDTHAWNIMKRRRTGEFVLTDACIIYGHEGVINVAN